MTRIGDTQDENEAGVAGDTMSAQRDAGQRSTKRRMGRLVSLSRVAIVLAVLASYICVVEALGFYAVVHPLPGESMIQKRVAELGVLWVILWSAIGWKTGKKDRLGSPLADWVIIAALPLVAGLVIAFWRFVAMSPMRTTGPGWWMTWVGLAIPLATGACGAGMLMLQGWAWQKYAAKPQHGCRSCAYDLTGNLSGVCPECGAPIVPTAEEIAQTLRRKSVGAILAGTIMLAMAIVAARWPESPFTQGNMIVTRTFLLIGPLLVLMGVVHLLRGKG